MAEQQGGMRRPQNPAPVSGPGRLSQRTDGGPQQVLSDVSGLAYGENQAMESLQSAAPMSAAGQTTPRATRRGGSGRAAQRAAGRSMVPLMSPTQRPDEPVTDGASVGPGRGPTVAQMPAPGELANTVRKMVGADPTGESLRLLAIAERLGW